jgi:hypothetical protein
MADPHPSGRQRSPTFAGGLTLAAMVGGGGPRIVLRVLRDDDGPAVAMPVASAAAAAEAAHDLFWAQQGRGLETGRRGWVACSGSDGGPPLADTWARPHSGSIRAEEAPGPLPAGAASGVPEAAAGPCPPRAFAAANAEAPQEGTGVLGPGEGLVWLGGITSSPKRAGLSEASGRPRASPRAASSDGAPPRLRHSLEHGSCAPLPLAPRASPSHHQHAPSQALQPPAGAAPGPGGSSGGPPVSRLLSVSPRWGAS